MSISPVGSDPAIPTQGSGKRQISQDQFLQLLVTQLQHQDPLKPQDDSALLAQLAQFSALEQAKQLTATGQQQRAFALLGHQVTAARPDGEPLSGKVLAVTLAGDSVQLELPYGVQVDAGTVTRVSP